MSVTHKASPLAKKILQAKQVLQVHPDDELKVVLLPMWCQEKKDVNYLSELRVRVPKVRSFLFVQKKSVRLEIEAYSKPWQKDGNSILNEYASLITGYDTFGPLTVVCLYNDKIIDMHEFAKLCTENGKFLREYSDKDKKFSGFYGDMLHRLVRGTAKHPECPVCGTKLPAANSDSASAAADAGSAAADSGSAAADSGSAAADSGSAVD